MKKIVDAKTFQRVVQRAAGVPKLSSQLKSLIRKAGASKGLLKMGKVTQTQIASVLDSIRESGKELKEHGPSIKIVKRLVQKEERRQMAIKTLRLHERAQDIEVERLAEQPGSSQKIPPQRSASAILIGKEEKPQAQALSEAAYEAGGVSPPVASVSQTKKNTSQSTTHARASVAPPETQLQAGFSQEKKKTEAEKKPIKTKFEERSGLTSSQASSPKPQRSQNSKSPSSRKQLPKEEPEDMVID